MFAEGRRVITKVLDTPEKKARKAELFQIGLKTLQRKGWSVERIAGFGKASVRQITKGNKTLRVSIRTTQDTWIAFPRNQEDTGWVTLDDVDAVVAVSVDGTENPRSANVHLLSGDDVRERFNRAYKARLAAGHQIPRGRGVWLSLYREDDTEPVTSVGAGAGLASPPIAQVPLGPAPTTLPMDRGSRAEMGSDGDEKPLTIPEAKRRLGRTLGVDPANIRIIVEA